MTRIVGRGLQARPSPNGTQLFCIAQSSQNNSKVTPNIFRKNDGSQA